MKDERIKALKKEIKRIKKENKEKVKIKDDEIEIKLNIDPECDKVFNDEDMKRIVSNSLSNLFNTEKRIEVDENGKEWKVIEGFTKDNKQYEDFYNVRKEWFRDDQPISINFELVDFNKDVVEKYLFDDDYKENTEDSKEFKSRKIKLLKNEIDNLNKELENFIIDWNNLNLMISRRDILQCELNKLTNINNNEGDE